MDRKVERSYRARVFSLASFVEVRCIHEPVQELFPVSSVGPLASPMLWLPPIVR